MVENSKTLLFIPTYNEAENVEKLFHQIMEMQLHADILFLDDNSPDGTGQIIDRLALEHDNVYALHRPGKLGIGSAHKDGILWAYEHQYQRLITMDCDFTHSPEYIPIFLNHSSKYDVVIGSRYLKENSLPGWNIYRKFLTHLGHFLTKTLLSMPYDASGAFRVYRLDRIDPDIFKLVSSDRYSFFFESLHILGLNGHSIKEYPIHLPNRAYGSSKMSFYDIVNSLKKLFTLFVTTRSNRESLILQNPEPLGVKAVSQPAAKYGAWDAYWSAKLSLSGVLYDVAATFFRTIFFRPTLRHFLNEYFCPTQKILHAGSGGGEVDADIAKQFDIVPLDISRRALTLYKETNKGVSHMVCGDLLHIPVKSETFNGIYNLGVMEHFSADEITHILFEFHRVLKSEGKIVLFWPASFGLSVRSLKFIHYVANNLLKKKVTLHPEEITLIESKDQAEAFLARSGFTLLDSYFGRRDFFTHLIIVAKKNGLLVRGQIPQKSGVHEEEPCPVQPMRFERIRRSLSR